MWHISEHDQKVLGTALQSVPRYDEITIDTRRDVERYFADQLGVIKEAFASFNEIRKELFEDIPADKASPMVTQVSEFANALRQVLTFDPLQSNSPQQKNNLLAEISRCRSKFFTNLTPLIALYNYRTAGKATQPLEPLVDELRERGENAVSYIEDKMTKVDDLYDVMTDNAARVGVAAHSEIFANEYQRYKKESARWLLTTAITAVLGVAGILALLLVYPPLGLKPLELVNYAAIKLFLISVFYVALSFLMKNYSAAKHNAVVNQHRANATSTFELFADQGKDPATKDMVLRQVTDAIFAMQSTGFLIKDPASHPAKNITEVLTSIPKGDS